MRSPAPVRLLLPLMAAGWSGALLLEALDRWRFERVCATSCGPFWPPDLALQLAAAMDWHKPLALAALPPALWGARHATRAFFHHPRTPAA